MRVLVIGGGGREHALSWALARSASVDHVVCAPGNVGIEGVASGDNSADILNKVLPTPAPPRHLQLSSGNGGV